MFPPNFQNIVVQIIKVQIIKVQIIKVQMKRREERAAGQGRATGKC
jgi:hypothetical protein